MKRIVILTGAELRHEFFRKTLASWPGIHVLSSYCENQENDLRSQVVASREDRRLRVKHLNTRANSERLTFAETICIKTDTSNPIDLPRGTINSDQHVQSIIASCPDLVLAYGCSIIKKSLLSAFPDCFINVHLGLSPYYRGSGTNFWPLVNGEPEYVGATFMHIDSGIDTGDIIHQIRAEIVSGDTPSTIGNRLIKRMSLVAREIVVSFDTIVPMVQPLEPPDAKRYRSEDFTESSVTKLYENFKNGLVDRYLNEQVERCARVPILSNPSLDRDCS